MKYVLTFLGIAGVVSGYFLPSASVGELTYFFDNEFVLISAGVLFIGVITNLKPLLLGVVPLLGLKAYAIYELTNYLKEVEGLKVGLGSITGYIGAFLLVVAATTAFNDSTINSKLKHNTKEIRY